MPIQADIRTLAHVAHQFPGFLDQFNTFVVIPIYFFHGKEPAPPTANASPFPRYSQSVPSDDVLTSLIMLPSGHSLPLRSCVLMIALLLVTADHRDHISILLRNPQMETVILDDIS